ncbi:MAG: hypothetical protein ACI8WB_004463 [Phenylobacterium sp.]|jgi:hypothetical protein
MKASHYPQLLLLLGLTLMVGCSGEEQTSGQADVTTELIEVNERKMLGAWQSTDQLQGFEFHASPAQFGAIVAIEYEETFYQPEGVVYQNGQPSLYFTWLMLANGSLRLDVKKPSCQSRPLVLCATDSVQTIQVIGSNVARLTFQIAEDLDLDGKADHNFEWQLSKKALPNLNVGDKSYLIETMNRASSQFLTRDNNGSLELFVPTSTGDRKFVESNRDQYSIDLVQAGEIRTSREFYVYNHGDTDINILNNYEYFRIYPAFNDALMVSFKVNRSFELDGSFSASDVDLNGYLLNFKRSQQVAVANVSHVSPTIVYGKPYFSNLFEVFDIIGLDNGIANKIVFLDDHSAQLSSGDVLADGPFVEQLFAWRKGSHDGEFIFENNEVVVTMEFVSGDSDRYRVIISTFNKADAEYLVKYSSELFFSQNDNVDLASLFPLEFEFTHTNGITVSPVRLLDGGEVELVNVDEVQGGRWIINGNELVRFECVTVAEVEITDYQECLDSFQYVATSETKTDYSHISRLRFVNKIGNNYLVQYDAAFWGGRWGREDHIRRFTSYYQWVHLAQ